MPNLIFKLHAIRIVGTFALLCLSSAVMAEKPAAETAIDSIIATVNDDIITESELDEAVVATRAKMRKRKISTPPEKLLREQVLKQLILEKLQLQLAQRTGIAVNEEDVDATIRRIMKAGKLTSSALEKKLRSENLTMAQYREDIKKQAIIQQLVDREVKRRIFVSDSEIDSLLEHQQKNSNDSYQVSHILLTLPEAATAEVINTHQQRANDLVERLKAGADFSALAAKHSSGREALNGGELGWRKAGELPDLFAEALAKMAKGDISEPLRSANGFHILKLNGIRSDRKSRVVTQYRVRHILVKTNQVMPEAEARNKIKQLRLRLQSGDSFANVAMAHSEDPGSAAKGGELGWVNPGQMVPEFEKAFKTLSIGKLSQPVKSPYGFHLIEVLEHRKKDIGNLLDRAQAREQLGLRKMDQRYQQWLQQLENEAYIQIKPDNMVM